MVDTSQLLGAALSLRVTADTSGLEADLASKLTGAERVALGSAERISSETGRLAQSSGQASIAMSDKVVTAQLRVTAAQERYNALLQDENATTGQRASAQATLISAQGRLRSEQVKSNLTLSEGTQVVSRLSLALAGAGAAAAAFTIHSVHTYQDLGSEVKTLARLTGETVDQASRLRFATIESGITVDTMATSIKTLSKHLVENDDAAGKLGVTYRDTSGQLLPMNEILGNIADRFAGLEDGPEKSALAVQAFGRQGVAMLPFLNRGSQGLADLGDEAQRLGLVLTDSAVEGLNQATQATKDLHAASEAVQVAIGSKVLPIITEFKEVAAGGLRFVAEHQTTATIAAFGTVGAAAFAKVGGAAASFNEIVQAGSQILARFRRGEAVAENVALARSYDAVTASATRAAVAETAAGTAAGAGGAAALTGAGLTSSALSIGGTGLSRIGILGRTGMAVRALSLGGAAALANPMLLPLLFGGGDETPKDLATARSTQWDLFKNFSYRDGAYYAGQTKITDPRTLAILQAASGPGGVAVNLRNAPGTSDADYTRMQAQFPGLFGPQSSDEGLKNQFVTQNTLLRGSLGTEATRAATVQAVRSGGLAFATGTDIFSRAPRIGPNRENRVDALAALDKARASQTTAQNQAELAERRLNSLRRSGEATALQLASAEESLRSAKERSAAASKTVKDAEKAVDDTRLPTAKSLLETTKSQRERADRDAKAVTRLYASGLGKNVVAQIIEENADTPGALERVARTMTPKLAAALNRQFKQLRIDGSVLAGTPDQWYKAGLDRATDFYDGFIQGFNRKNTPTGLPGQRRRQGRAGRTGAYILDPDYGSPRRRQRSLSGAP